MRREQPESQETGARGRQGDRNNKIWKSRNSKLKPKKICTEPNASGKGMRSTGLLRDRCNVGDCRFVETEGTPSPAPRSCDSLAGCVRSTTSRCASQYIPRRPNLSPRWTGRNARRRFFLRHGTARWTRLHGLLPVVTESSDSCLPFLWLMDRLVFRRILRKPVEMVAWNPSAWNTNSRIYRQISTNQRRNSAQNSETRVRAERKSGAIAMMLWRATSFHSLMRLLVVNNGSARDVFGSAVWLVRPVRW